MALIDIDEFKEKLMALIDIDEFKEKLMALIDIDEFKENNVKHFKGKKRTNLDLIIDKLCIRNIMR